MGGGSNDDDDGDDEALRINNVRALVSSATNEPLSLSLLLHAHRPHRAEHTR